MKIQAEMLTDLKNGITEFEEKEGTITIEFSVKKSELKNYFEELDKLHSNIGNWFAFSCDTCVEQHGDGYVHLELVKDVWADSYIQSSNLLAQTNYKRN